MTAGAYQAAAVVGDEQSIAVRDSVQEPRFHCAFVGIGDGGSRDAIDPDDLLLR